MSSQEIYHEYGQELYFFTLKRVSDTTVANDIVQNTFLKIHKNIHQLKSDDSTKAWVYQICRNEIANYFISEQQESKLTGLPSHDHDNGNVQICCFDKFVDEMPAMYKEVVELTFIDGKKQLEVAEVLDISIANVKARVRRAKELLKTRFQECCKYEVDQSGRLVGPPNCATCE
ncbi:MAG: sigma-70 family RNA polymerase sigma factor [Bacteroidota bacterium]